MNYFSFRFTPPISPFPVKRFALTLGLVVLAGCGSTSEVYVDRGNRFFDNGKYDDAAIQYQKAIQKTPRSGEAHYRLALLRLKKNQLFEAYRELQSATQIMPDNRDALAKSGEVALALYNANPKHPQQPYDQAAKAAQQLLAKNPGDFEGNLLKGYLSMVESKPADAIASFRRAADAKPGDADATLGLAQALARDGQISTAIDVARKAIETNKNFGAAYDFLYAQYRAAGKLDEAEGVLKLKVANNPKQADYIVGLSRHYAAARKTAEMNTAIQQLANRPSEFPNGRALAGDFYASINQPDQALEQYRQGLTANPKESALYRKRIVRMLVLQRKWPEAEEQLSMVLKDQPADSESKLVRALVWLDEGKQENLDPAITELRAQLVKMPSDPALHFQLGTALARKGDTDNTRREWVAAGRLNPAYLPSRIALVQLDLGQGKPQDALSVSEELVKTAPADPQARLMHATCLTAVGQYPQARSELNALAVQFPDVPQVRFRVAMLALAEGRFKDAEEMFRRLLPSSAGDPEVIAGLAQAYQGQNEPAKALQLITDELKRTPASTPLRQMFARLAMASGKSGLAIEQFRQLAAAAPKSVQAQLALAAAYDASGDHNASIGVLEKTLGDNPKSPAVLLPLAQSLIGAGRVNDAKARYHQLLAAEPNNANALNDLAFLMAESGDDLDQALAFAQQSQQSATTAELKQSVSDTLGWIYLKKKMNDSALQVFNTLVRNNPDNATFHYHLGATLLERGEKQKARTELQAALAARPASPYEPKIRELLARF